MIKKRKMERDNKWPLFRLVIPAFPEVNIFSRVAKKTTALGPIMVATAASKLWGWRVEVIDENNCKGAPLDENDLPPKNRDADFLNQYISDIIYLYHSNYIMSK